MKEFEVTITETLQKTVTVEAESREEAENQINKIWSDGEIILDADDFADVEFHSDEGKEIGEKEIIDVLMVEPGRYPRTEKIGSDLKSMQKAVGGYIQAAYFFDDPVALVCDEEGKVNGSALNRAIRDENGEILDIIAGKFFICGLTDDSFASLSPELMTKFEEKFHQPETFLKMGKKIMALPVEPAIPASGREKPAITEER